MPVNGPTSQIVPASVGTAALTGRRVIITGAS
jgi:hypothetical protein